MKWMPLVFAVVFAFMEHCQHSDFEKEHPDYEKCPSAVLGFGILAVIILAVTIFGD